MTVRDPIKLELVRNSLLMAAMEMKNVVVRTAYSTLWKEAGDLSCGVLTPESDIIAQGPGDIPVHLASMPLSLSGCLHRFPAVSLKPGDVLIQNDPSHGNNHLPDLFMAMPTFVGDVLVGFAAVRGHHVDIGGVGPGSYTALTRDIHAEGLRLPPVKLYRAGRLNKEILDIFLANIRGPTERMGDLRAQEAGVRNGGRSLERLASVHGTEEFLQQMAEILDHSERLTRAQIGGIPPGTYHFADFCDVQGELLRIEVAVTVETDRVIVDFSGTDRQGRHGLNCPIAVCESATYYAIKCVTDPDNPPNSGCYRAIDVRAPEGSLVNAVYPASVVLGNHETSMRIVDAILGALAPAIPDRVVAAGSGSAGIFVLAGTDRRNDAGRPFTWIEPGGGGQGAAIHADGRSGMRVNVGNTGNTPTEAIETHFPVTVRSYELAEDSGGPGTRRGGCGLRRIFEVGQVDDPVLTVSLERAAVPPYGLMKGSTGTPAHVRISRAEEVILNDSKTSPTDLQMGDLVVMQCAGSGGYGDPLARPSDLVLADVLDGYVSVHAALISYGVVVDDTGDLPFVDESATLEVRSRLLRESGHSSDDGYPADDNRPKDHGSEESRVDGG